MLMRELLMISAWPANERMRPLEVTGGTPLGTARRYPAMRELQFGEWLRADIEAGRIEPPQRTTIWPFFCGRARTAPV